MSNLRALLGRRNKAMTESLAALPRGMQLAKGWWRVSEPKLAPGDRQVTKSSADIVADYLRADGYAKSVTSIQINTAMSRTTVMRALRKLHERKVVTRYTVGTVGVRRQRVLWMWTGPIAADWRDVPFEDEGSRE